MSNIIKKKFGNQIVYQIHDLNNKTTSKKTSKKQLKTKHFKSPEEENAYWEKWHDNHPNDYKHP